MKKTLLLFLLMIGILTGNAQYVPTNIASVSNEANRIKINFNLPAYQVKDTCFYEIVEISEIFNFIDVEAYCFNLSSEEGLPQLPFIGLPLNVPYNSSDYSFTLSDIQTETIYLPHRIIPSQKNAYPGEEVEFIINNDFYLSDKEYSEVKAKLSDAHTIRGEKGIVLTIFPFIYHPERNQLTVIKSLTASINFNMTNHEKAEESNTVAHSEYLSNIFLNYPYYPQRLRMPDNPEYGKYLIITAPGFQNDLTYFANYKRNIGYDVTVVSTSTTGISASSIKNYIKNRYNNASTRPDFILLVGTKDHIPVSATNPMTDLHYAYMEGNNYVADIHLGRFPVKNSTELINLINKTISMEMNQWPISKKAKFLVASGSSDETGPWQSSTNDIINNPLQRLYECQKVYNSEEYQAIAALNDNPRLFVYSGHGGEFSWDLGNYYLGASFFSDDSRTNTVFPMVYAITCLSGSFNDSSMARYCLNATKGGVTYFGSSISVSRTSNSIIKKSIFSPNFYEHAITVKSAINMGLYLYYTIGGDNLEKTRSFQQSYNFFGDPSFRIKGLDIRENFVLNQNEVFNNKNEITYIAKNSITTNNTFQINSGAKVGLKAGKQIILKPGFHAKTGSNFTAKIENVSSTAYSQMANGNAPYENPVTITAQKENSSPFLSSDSFSLFPNPTSDNIAITYTLKEKSDVVLEVYDLSGRLIQIVYSESSVPEGTYQKNIELDQLEPSTYIYQFKTNYETVSGKLIRK